MSLSSRGMGGGQEIMPREAGDRLRLRSRRATDSAHACAFARSRRRVHVVAAHREDRAGRVADPRRSGETGPRLRPVRVRALPEDIAVLNRRAVERGDLEITALSVRTWADVHRRYAVTACGASFGDGFGPKVVHRQGDSRFDSIAKIANSEALVAIPGKGTTAFMMMNLVLGVAP